jgi:hypothetical protein
LTLKIRDGAGNETHRVLAVEGVADYTEAVSVNGELRKADDA